MDEKVAIRFWERVQKTDTCWLWIGQKNSKGYGQFSPITRVEGRKQAHLFLYEDINGPVPVGLLLDHTCRNRACVRPDHLEPVTNKVNILRGESFSAINARKTHCNAGHELQMERNGRGDRVCKKCQSVYSKRHEKRRRNVL